MRSLGRFGCFLGGSFLFLFDNLFADRDNDGLGIELGDDALGEGHVCNANCGTGLDTGDVDLDGLGDGGGGSLDQQSELFLSVLGAGGGLAMMETGTSTSTSSPALTARKSAWSRLRETG